MRTVWLASYPKSGNTWLRMLIANLSAKDDKPVDINDLAERGGIASAREPFDHLLLIESGLLTHDETDNFRPRVYEELARGAEDDEYDAPDAAPAVRFVKVHDAYTLTPIGEPLLGGLRGAGGAIVIVRDPRDVAHRSPITIAAVSTTPLRSSTTRAPRIARGRKGSTISSASSFQAGVGTSQPGSIKRIFRCISFVMKT